jgi:PAS domain S-box-containing protein
MVSTGQDVPETTQEHNLWLMMALRAGKLAIWDWNLLTQEVNWSDNAESLFGLETGVLAGTHEAFLELIHPADRPEMVQAIQRVLAIGGSFQVEHRLLMTDGSSRWFESRGQLFDDQAKPLRYLVGTVQDIAERKQTEQALRQSEARYRTIFELAKVSMWEEDVSEFLPLLEALQRQGVDDLRHYLAAHPEFITANLAKLKVVDVNRETIRLHGARSKAELLGGLDKIFLPESLHVLVEALVALAEGRSHVEGETVYQTLQGERFEALYRITLPPKGSDSSQVLVSVLDIADRKQVEEQIKRRLESEKAISALSSRFVNSPNLDQALKASLEVIGVMCKAERVSLFQLDEALHTLDNTHSWSAGGGSPRPHPLQNLPFPACSWLIAQLRQGELLIIEDVSRLPVEAGSVRVSLEAQQIRSFLVMPLLISQRIRGFISCENVVEAGPWWEKDWPVLRVSSEIIGNALERARVEQALRESEDRFRTLIEQSPVGIIIYAPEGDLVYGNPAARKLYGWSDEHYALRRAHYNILQDDRLQADGLMPYLEQAFAGTTVVLPPIKSVHEPATNAGEGSAPIGRSSKGAVWTEGSIYPIKNSQGKIQEVVVMQQDITPRKQMEAALRASQQRLSQALRAARAGAWEWNARTNEAIWSDENYLVMGLTPGCCESHYTAWLECVHPDDRTEANLGVAQAVAERSDLNIEFRVIWPDGSIHWINDIGKMVSDEAGEPVGMYGIQLDITHRKEAEALITASLQEKEVLLKEVQHRVKNNLQIISSLLDLQADYIGDSQTRKLLRETQARVRSMALIHELLYQNRDLARVDFGKYIDSLVGYLRQLYGAKANPIVLRSQIAPIYLNVGQAVPCGLIINELVSNAFKHAFPHGRPGEVWVKFKVTRDSQFVLHITDNGVGFPETLDSRSADSLGLTLVNTLVKQLNGQIQRWNNQGTEFELTFKIDSLTRTGDGS